MLNQMIERILRARVYEVARESPLAAAPRLSQRLGNRVWIKREDLQPVFSFKLRGAFNKIVHLSAAQRRRGVIAASAGNHAQGVALAARELGLEALIVMPRTTAAIKVEAVRALGATIVLEGDNYDAAGAHALGLAAARGLTLVHPFDDLDVIAGQGTIGMEILRQHSGPLHALFVPVGGGGLIAGVGAYSKFVRPETRVIGVEPDDAPTLSRALAAGRRVVLDHVGPFADGAAVRQIGRETFRLARRVVDEVILVSTDETCGAIKDIFEDTRTIAEPAGALAVAGLKKYVARERLRDAALVAIESGANMNFDRLRHVAERAELGEQREALLAVTIPERPGSFLAFCQAIGERNLTEFNYRYHDAARAQVFVGVELSEGQPEREALVARLVAAGYGVVDLTDNETAKLHIRYMVGGHAQGLRDETLWRVEFPERRGALLGFLREMGGRWNISLFHYRNHGADYGRVLIGLQLDARARRAFVELLHGLGFPHHEETHNPACRSFAGAEEPAAPLPSRRQSTRKSAGKSSSKPGSS